MARFLVTVGSLLSFLPVKYDMNGPIGLCKLEGCPSLTPVVGTTLKSVGPRSFHTFEEIISYNLIFWPELDLWARDTEG